MGTAFFIVSLILIILSIDLIETIDEFRPLANGSGEDCLVVEVWDFDAAESIGEKISKIPHVKGIWGVGRLMKEIAQTASMGKHDNELIGKCFIPLRVSCRSNLH